MSQSCSKLGLRANCALPNLPRLNQRQGFYRKASQTYNWKVSRASFSQSSPTGRKNFATCVDAPLGAREIFKSGVARGRVLTCVRPLMRLTRRRPGWEFADQVQVRPTRLKRLSQSWLSRSRLSTVAPSLSFDPPTPRQPRGRGDAYTAATGAR